MKTYSKTHNEVRPRPVLGSKKMKVGRLAVVMEFGTPPTTDTEFYLTNPYRDDLDVRHMEFVGVVCAGADRAEFTIETEKGQRLVWRPKGVIGANEMELVPV